MDRRETEAKGAGEICAGVEIEQEKRGPRRYTVRDMRHTWADLTGDASSPLTPTLRGFRGPLWQRGEWEALVSGFWGVGECSKPVLGSVDPCYPQ